MKGVFIMYQVIIVDDEAKIRSGLVNLFPWSQLGFEVAGCFANGKEAYEFILGNHVDLILSDIRMPMDWNCQKSFLQRGRSGLFFSADTRISTMSDGLCAAVPLTIS